MTTCANHTAARTDTPQTTAPKRWTAARIRTEIATQLEITSVTSFAAKLAAFDGDAPDERNAFRVVRHADGEAIVRAYCPVAGHYTTVHSADVAAVLAWEERVRSGKRSPALEVNGRVVGVCVAP